MTSRPMLLAPLALGAFTLLALAGLGCNDEYPPKTYSPDKATYEAMALEYSANPVKNDPAGVIAIGHSSEQTDLSQGESLAMHDAAVQAARNSVIATIGSRLPEAGVYYRESPRSVVDAVESALESYGVLIYRADLISDYRSMFDTYRVALLPAAKQEMVVAQLIDIYRRLADAALEADVEFSVVLADLQRLTYQERLKMVMSAMQTKLGELGYGGQVVSLDADTAISPEEVARRKRDLTAQIPNGASVEISLTLSIPSRKKLRSLALYSTRQRKLAPINITEHPEPVGGRYQYEIAIGSHYIKKGSTSVRVEVMDADGKSFEEEYPITGKFQFTDGNIGLMVIKSFRGHLQNLTRQLKNSIRLPDEEGKPTVMLDFSDTSLGMRGQVGAGSGGAGLAYKFRIALMRPSATTVWVLPPEHSDRVDYAALRDVNRVKSLPWTVVWEEVDPSGKYGDLNSIEAPSNKTMQLYAMIAYNGGKDFDVLLFDFHDRNPQEILREAQVVFSTRARQ